MGWQQYFEILWGVTPRQDRDALIEGYITNTWGFAVREVRVLVNGYDSSGTQTGQLIAWGPNESLMKERSDRQLAVLVALMTRPLLARKTFTMNCAGRLPFDPLQRLLGRTPEEAMGAVGDRFTPITTEELPDLLEEDE
jgi:hypothetical protein